MSNNIDKELESLFADWQSRMKEQDRTAHFTKDGLMFNSIPREQTERAWRASRHRILFLLKDQHQDGNEKWDEDIRYWLKDAKWDTGESRLTKEANRNLESPFIKNLAYILWGLSKADNDNPWWYDEITAHIDEVKEFFNTRSFAVVECKKQPGGGSLNDKVLKQHLHDYGDLLKREIKILAPSMIVCTSRYIYDFVLKMYPQEELAGIEGHNSIRIHTPSGTLLFCSYHPSAFGMSKSDIYEGVMHHYRAYLKRNSD